MIQQEDNIRKQKQDIEIEPYVGTDHKSNLEYENTNIFDVFIVNELDDSYGEQNSLDMGLLQISDNSENDQPILRKSDDILNFQDSLDFTRSILSKNTSETLQTEKQLTIKHVIPSLKFSDNRFFGLFSNNLVPYATVQHDNDLNFKVTQDHVHMTNDVDQLLPTSEVSWSEIQGALNSMLHTIDTPLSFIQLHEIMQNLTKLQISKQLLFAHVVQLSQSMNLYLLNELEEKQDFTIIIKG